MRVPLDAAAGPSAAARQVRAAASAAGIRCSNVSWVDAVAAVAGARLWCAVTGKEELSLSQRWPGMAAPVALWGVRILHRGAGCPTSEVFDDVDGWGADAPPPQVAARVLAAAAAADALISDVPGVDPVAVWSAVGADACVDSGHTLWVCQVVASYRDDM